MDAKTESHGWPGNGGAVPGGLEAQDGTSTDVLAAARAALSRGDVIEGERLFEELLASPELAAEAHYGLGWIELQRGNQAEAVRRFQEALKLDNSHANSWFALGRLTEPRSQEQAVAYYQRAIEAQPDHFGAIERLRELGVAAPSRIGDTAGQPAQQPREVTHIETTQTNSPASVPAAAPTPPVQTSPVAPEAWNVGAGRVGELGIVEYLRDDPNQVSKQALARIESLNRSNHFRFTAHLQHLLVRLIVFVGIVAAVAGIAHRATRNGVTISGSSYQVSGRDFKEVVGVAVLLWLLWAAWVFLKCALNKVTFANGRIRWTRGVLNKHAETLDLWTVTDIELDRNFVQRLTGDGTLTFKGTRHEERRRRGSKPLRLTGVARGDDLDQIYAELLDLKFLLRANPGLKGLIQ